MVREEREKEETRKNPEEWTGMIDCSEIQEEGEGNKKSGPEWSTVLETQREKKEGVARRVDRNDRLFLDSGEERGRKSSFFFCCIAERAIKPCRSSRSKLRGEFGIPRHLQNTNQKHNQATSKQNTKQTKDTNRQVLECETRGEKRVKRPKRPNALICRTPGGSMRYP